MAIKLVFSGIQNLGDWNKHVHEKMETKGKKSFGQHSQLDLAVYDIPESEITGIQPKLQTAHIQGGWEVKNSR